MRGLVIGFGVVGANAARHLLDIGVAAGGLVVVDWDAGAVERAGRLGARTVLGDAADCHVIDRAVVGHVDHVVVAVGPDETALLSTIVVRERCPSATIVTAVRHRVHIPLVRSHGADRAIVTSEATGAALGHAVSDVSMAGPGGAARWSIAERPVRPFEVGCLLRDCAPSAIGLLRGPGRGWESEAAGQRVAEGDRIVFLTARSATGRTEA
ncbi:NAD-binding protein [Actinokineospora sp. 24-640]